MLFIKCAQTAIRADVIAFFDRRVRAGSYAFDCVDEKLKRAGVLYPTAKINPGASAEKRRQRVGVERFGKSGLQYEEETKGTIFCSAV